MPLVSQVKGLRRPSLSTLRVAVDAMGGDSAPANIVEGAVRAAEQLPAPPHIVLVGQMPRMEAELVRLGKRPRLIELHHASEVVEMSDHPSQAIRQRKDSSLRVCFDLMEAGKVDAVVSAGNSGAMLAGALLVSGRLPGVDRPAIGAVFPSLSGRTLMLDAGANAECKPLHLVQFALMGEVYARRMLGIEKPRVGVLSNGEEETKGTDLTRAAAAALRGMGDEFIGYAEGNDLFNGAVDVAVCDGFVGNMILKAAEGVAQAIVSTLRQTMKEDAMASAGMLLARRALRRFREAMDWETVGGAPLVGCRGVSIVAHGRSGPKAIMNAVRVAAEAAAVGMDAELSEAAKLGRELLGPRKTAVEG